jgi:hypothetical protein
MEKAGDERDAPDPNDCFLAIRPSTSGRFLSFAHVKVRPQKRTQVQVADRGPRPVARG